MKPPDYKPPQNADELLQRYQHGERYFGESELDQETCDFREAILENIVFSPHSFIDADFRNAKLKGADFSNCNVKCCNFRAADLRVANFKDAAIDAAEFEGADLEGADFTGASAYGIYLKAGEKPVW